MKYYYNSELSNSNSILNLSYRKRVLRLKNIKYNKKEEYNKYNTKEYINTWRNTFNNNWILYKINESPIEFIDNSYVIEDYF